MENIREYTSGNVTVIWKPSLCMHSERCWRGLPEVFKPEEKPWIQPGETNSEKLIEQVGLCPSGALTYRMHGENKSSSPQSLRIKVSKDGPLLIKDTVFIELENETSVKREKAVALCRCGAFANKPYCDGSHRRIQFKG